MSHQHHHHEIAPVNYNKRFLLGIILNVLLVVGQIIYGYKANSVALLSDAFHNAGDVLGLVIAWAGFHIGSLKPSDRFTYGFKNTTIIAAFINAVLLFIAVGGIAWEALMRLNQPESVQPITVIIVAFAGVVINGITALFFITGKHDINLRGAFLHMASDAAVSLGVIIGAAVIFYTQWFWIDPALCLGISLLIVLSSWRLCKESINLILHAVPEHISPEEVRKYLLAHENVVSVHDLHIWAISTSETALSAHIIVAIQEKDNAILKQLSHDLAHQFKIQHATIQIELQSDNLSCDVSCEKG
ncbi:MAG: cation transporter [Proteobacteria bacterium]|nr:cation transporter [Pseudomonadota bacterium]